MSNPIMTEAILLVELERLENQVLEVDNQLEAIYEEHLKLHAKREELEYVLRETKRHIRIIEQQLERDYPETHPKF